jgi:hypothetical protein
MSNKETIIEVLNAAGMYIEAYKLKNCMKDTLLVRCDKCGRQIYVHRRCDLRICPDCSPRYSRMLFKRFFPFVRKLMGDKRHYTLKLLTLTVTNTRKLSDESIKTLFKNARKLMREFFNKRKGAGALAVLEAGKNLNLHIHLLVYGPFVLQERLSDRWGEITRGSFIVDIRMAKGKPEGVLNYVLKYITKPCSFEDPRFYAVYLAALKGVRRVHTFGIFYNMVKISRGTNGCICGGKFRLDLSLYGPWWNFSPIQDRLACGSYAVEAR